MNPIGCVSILWEEVQVLETYFSTKHRHLPSKIIFRNMWRKQDLERLEPFHIIVIPMALRYRTRPTSFSKSKKICSSKFRLSIHKFMIGTEKRELRQLPIFIPILPSCWHLVPQCKVFTRPIHLSVLILFGAFRPFSELFLSLLSRKSILYGL